MPASDRGGAGTLCAHTRAMYARVGSGTIVGIDAQPITVEAHRGKGLPGDTVIGLVRGATAEAVFRVHAAIRAAGIELPKTRVLVNLLPAELPKDASGLDLPLAVALLASAGFVPTDALAGCRLLGELSLGGTLEPVRGAVLLADLVRRLGERELIVPYENASEAAIIPGVRVIAARSLAEVVSHLNGARLPVTLPGHAQAPPARRHCLSEVRGQRRAKQALEIAAAGGHNVLLVGPPGSGKTMLSRRLPGILPELSSEESIEVTRIHSAAGLLAPGQGLVRTRPFRAPHHTASEPAICGGGSQPRPGEITLAHRGVLFLDELPEFSRRTLESLREPLEAGEIHVARARTSLVFPADVILVAAMNPCPCGRYRPGNPCQGAPCLCAMEQITRYRARISGPLLDRIDLQVWAEALPYRDYVEAEPGETTAQVVARVLRARAAQADRLGPDRLNARMREEELLVQVTLNAAMLRVVEQAIDERAFSSRAVTRMLKVSRTIADLAGAATVEVEHVRQALAFRVMDTSQHGLAGEAATDGAMG